MFRKFVVLVLLMQPALAKESTSSSDYLNISVGIVRSMDAHELDVFMDVIFACSLERGPLPNDAWACKSKIARYSFEYRDRRGPLLALLGEWQGDIEAMEIYPKAKDRVDKIDEALQAAAQKQLDVLKSPNN
jgi:hypothetical protein